MTRLDPAFLTVPIAHRGLHDRDAGIIENGMSAFDAAIAGGYGIELDVQGAADASAFAFHDDDLDRLTDATGPFAARDADELAALRLRGSTTDRIPPLADVLAAIGGQVPLLVEIKDQDRRLGPNVGTLHRQVCDLLAAYSGPVAVMSFNPHTIAGVKEYAPHIPRGLVTDAFLQEDWPGVPAQRCAALSEIPDVHALGLDFISHNRRDLGDARVAALKSAGLPILTWTIRSAAEETTARNVADNITFEGYRPSRPGHA